MIQIPQKTIPKQVNQGDMFGDIWASWNLDLTSSPGKIKVSPKPIVDVASTNAGKTTLICPVAFARNMAGSGSVDTYFAVCDQRIYYNSSASGSAWMPDDVPSSPTTALSKYYSDAVDFNGTLVVSLKTALNSLSTAAWNSTYYSGITLTNNVPHPLCVSFNNLLLIGNGNKVISINKDNTQNTSAVVLGVEYEIIWIRSSNTTVWIGARHKYGGIGKVFTWDGYSENFNQDYKIASDMTFAGLIKNDICYTVNGNGQLLEFQGGGFNEIARFPVVDVSFYKLDDGLLAYPININHNGMALINDKINILLNAKVENSVGSDFLLENMLSGIWEYTPETGLYHKYSLTFNASDAPDLGVPSLIQAGALYPLNDNNRFYAGANFYKDDEQNAVSVINKISTESSKKIGYFITPKIYGNNIQEIWQKASLTFGKLLYTGDFIKIKYRTSQKLYPDVSDSAVTGTWTSLTTFTTNNDTVMAKTAVGDEVEIYTGEGAGTSTKITGLTGTYAVTIGTTMPANTSGAFMFRVANWTELRDITGTNQVYEEISIGEPSSWIQFKVLMYSVGNQYSLGNSPEIEKLFISSTPQIKAGG